MREPTRRGRIVAALLAGLVLFGAGLASASWARAGTGQQDSAGRGTASMLDAVLRRGEVRVCSTGDYRPFTYLDPATGAWSGIDVDMARDMAGRLGVRLTLVRTTWGTLLTDLGRRCDLAMGGVSVTLERAAKAFFSDPYLTDGKTPITRCADADRFQTLEQIDRPGVRVVVNPGGTNEQFARQHLHQATIVAHPDNNTIFDEIIAGRADLMITDAAETRWQATRHPELCSVHPDQPFTFAEKAYLLPRDDVAFQQWVNQWLHLARNDGTYQRVSAPWLG
ncbi:transporter substrate-binding domain-containing protein [Goodfellowiella coeruleoviolacea]|uniref:Cyclohexadienyl dehydratase n=1 Tax=Goodfellowiella coeruleoviolacea TaxID=334858 RepID=A0AAE3GD56_9PSEU|nr:transporter substrate-binding domain-containing protein [Goodfellowiella coeruleoviolacea]MCP2165225.1 cyclohexadienyl dehydratase [Goodfellowiella coeruleoviolacea]